jgi:hypothetical protein
MAGMRKTTKKTNKNRKWVILGNKSDRGSDLNFFLGIGGQISHHLLIEGKLPYDPPNQKY